MDKKTMTRRAAVRIPPERSGDEIIEFLARRFSYHSPESWQVEIKAGRVLLNDKSAEAGTRLKGGDKIEYLMSHIPEPPVDTNYEILFEDGFILAVNKPGNLPCHPGGRYFNHTLWAMLKAERPEQDLSFVHRIDRETSGIVLIAKSAEAARNCRVAFESGKTLKKYLVSVEGIFPEKELDAQGWLIQDTKSLVRKKQIFVKEEPIGAGKFCHTHFRRVYTDGKLSLVEARPISGRTHQIRAVLCSLGFPLVGDKLYGPDPEIFLRFIEDRMTAQDFKRLRISRQALHASELHIPHPESGEMIELYAPLPPDMAGLRA